MQFNYFFIPLLFISYWGYGAPIIQEKTPQFVSVPTEKNTVITSFSDEGEHWHQELPHRSEEYPTQVIRMSSPIINQHVDCDQVNEIIDDVLVKKITSDKFTFTIYITCTYDPETFYATQFTISSYFDPLNDEGIDFLKSYLNQYNGSNLLGTKFTIESAKALIIALTISAGTKKNPNKPPFVEYRQDHSNFYFKSNYEMRNTLFTDVSARFYSNDPEKILPFLDKWAFAHAGMLYKLVLRDSNYILLQPERIFLMENGETLFVHNLKFYFANHCEQYENHKCLMQPSS